MLRAMQILEMSSGKRLAKIFGQVELFLLREQFQAIMQLLKLYRVLTGRMWISGLFIEKSVRAKSKRRELKGSFVLRKNNNVFDQQEFITFSSIRQKVYGQRLGGIYGTGSRAVRDISCSS